MKFLRAFFCVILTFCICFTWLYGYKKIPETSFQNIDNYKGILTLWQVDTFEGGTGSRRQFLLKVSRQFEKLYPGVLVMVFTYTYESAQTALKGGQKPDMISYGFGVDVTGAREIDVKEGTLGGVVGDKRYAVAWCRGGYAFIVNQNLYSGDSLPNSVTVSLNEYNLPEIALYQSGVTFDEVITLKQEKAYMQFVTGKTPCLLGTQRDLYRLKNRDLPIKVTAIDGYNDLYQYISIIGDDQGKYKYCQEFIQLLSSEKIQTQLSSIGMMSCHYTVNFDDENMRAMQNESGFKTVSAFSGSQTLLSLRHLSALALKGDASSADKLKNMLI